MPQILESEWTLDALRRREEERLNNERVSATSDAANAHPHAEIEISGNNWLAQAFRRRQEEERAKEALNKALRHDLEQAANGKENSVDDWLVAGFRRHEEEQRHMEDAVKAFGAASSLDVEPAFPTSVARGLVAIPDTAIASQKERPRIARRLIAIAGLLIVGGLFSLLALRTALFAPPKSPALVKAPPTATKDAVSPRESASPPAETASPAATKLIDTERGSENDATRQEPAPRAVAPIEAKNPPSETNAVAPPSVQAPANLEKQGAVPADAPQERPLGAPSGGNEAKPAPPPPAETEGKLNSEPQSVDPAKSGETIGAEKDQNASEAKQPAAGKKAKAAKTKSATGRHSSTKADPIASFLTRATNSVRKFFGKLGQNGNRSGR